MRNQSAREDLGATARRRQHPLDIVVVILGVCGSSGSATVRVRGPDQGSGADRLHFSSVQLSSVQTVPLVRPLGLPPVRHNEHHCVLSAFVVSCSCLAPSPPPLLHPSLSCCVHSFGQAGCLFILFLVPAQSVYIFGIGLPCISVCRIVSLSLCFLGLQESGQPTSSNSCDSSPAASCSAPMKSVFKLID